MEHKRSKFKSSPTLLECLPNEIFMEIFSYLNGVDVDFAFSNLSHRFQCLLLEYCQFFDFKSISKVKFDFIFRRYDTRKWKFLQLSNDEHTPGQIEYFCQSYSLADLCPQLESLSLLNIEHISKNHSLLYQSLSFTNLQSLKIESICGTTMTHCNLPKLKRLVVSSCRNTKWIMVIS